MKNVWMRCGGDTSLLIQNLKHQCDLPPLLSHFFLSTILSQTMLTRKTQILYPTVRNFYNAVLGVIRKKYSFVNTEGKPASISWPPYEEPAGAYEDGSPETHLGRLLIGYLEQLHFVRSGSLQETAGLRRKPRSCAFECTLRLYVKQGKTPFNVVIAMAFVREPKFSSPFITSEELADYLEELITTGKITRPYNVVFQAKFDTLRLCYINGSINDLGLDF